VKVTAIKPYSVQGEEGRGYYIVKVETDEGIYGLGEVGIRNWGGAITQAIEHLSQVVIGQDPWSTERLWQQMFRGGFFPADKVYCCAISAIDIALWDIKGKSVGMPVYKLLGGPVRDKVVCYPHNHSHAMEVEPLVESCLETKEEGWKFVRWGLPQDGDILEPRDAVRTAIRQFEAVRSAVGDEIDICFDVHTRLDLPDVVWLCREVEQYAPFFIEDPLRCENPDSFKTLRPRTHVPIAAGEQFSSKWEFRQLIEEEWIDYARVDMCIAGGFTEARKIAGWCETHYIKLVVHNPLGPVSSAACLQMNLATSNFGVQEQPRKPGETLPEVVPVHHHWEDGYMLPTDLPGLGIEFDREAAARQPSQKRELPQLRRRDGSFTNW
jgi:galactonate dehydratase